MARKEKAGGEAWWGGNRDGEFSFEHSELDKPETYPSRCILRLLVTQIWSLGVIAQPETHIFGLLLVGKEEGVGVHEIREGEHVRGEEKKVEGPALLDSTM